MSYNDKDWREAITKLIEITSRNEIRWTDTDLYFGDPTKIVDKSYSSELNGKIYVVSLTRYRYYFDESEFTWSVEHDFSIFEQISAMECRPIALAPHINVVSALFEAAQRNYSYNKNALGGLL